MKRKKEKKFQTHKIFTTENWVEMAVKKIKWMLSPANVKQDLQNDEFVRAITGYRNTPLEHNTLSPNELLFGLPDNEEDTIEMPGRQNQAEFEAKLKAREKAKEIKHEEQNTQETCRPWKMETMWQFRMEVAMHQQDGT